MKIRLLLILLTLTAGCAFAAAPLIFNGDLDGRETKMTVGQTAELHLSQASGTGYVWELAAVDAKVLKVGEYRTELSHPTMPGAPITLIWPLEAVGKGKVVLKAELVRPWMRDKPAQKVAITVVVE